MERAPVTITGLVICRCRGILKDSAEGHLTQHLTLKWTAGTVCRFSVSNPQTLLSPSHRLCSLLPFSFSYINAGHMFLAQFYCLKTIFNINNGIHLRNVMMCLNLFFLTWFLLTSIMKQSLCCSRVFGHFSHHVWTCGILSVKQLPDVVRWPCSLCMLCFPRGLTQSNHRISP